jgi:tetratricopeptide (TPR) repeat protein
MSSTPDTRLSLDLRANDELRGVTRSYGKTIEGNPKDAMAYTNLGKVLREKGNIERANAGYQREIKISPNYDRAYGNLAIAFHRQGNFSGEVGACRKAIEISPRNATAHHLSRIAQPLVELEPRLVAVVDGTPQPVDNAERLGYALLCYYKKQYAAAAHFWEGAFAQDPQQAENLTEEHRYKAACAAALAGASQGKEEIEEDERMKWRDQAFVWLRADLALRTKQLESGKPEDRKAVLQQMQHWQRDGDLSGIRDAEALAKLPESEREALLKLWADVEKLAAQAAAQSTLQDASQ